MTSAVDKVIVNNPKNVQTNLFLVEQTPSAERIDSFADESTGFNPYSSWNNNYKAAFELRETWPGWMSSAGASIDSACRLRTNLVKRSNTEYISMILACPVRQEMLPERWRRILWVRTAV